MNDVVHVDANFVNKRYTPLYPDRTLDKKIDKLCSKIDKLIESKETPKEVKIQNKKWPFWYLIFGLIIIYYIYFKIKQFFKSNVNTITQSPVGYRPSYG